MVHILSKDNSFHDRQRNIVLHIFVEISLACLGTSDSVYFGDSFVGFIICNPIYSLDLVLQYGSGCD